MSKRFILVMLVVFAATIAVSAFGETEDEIIARYLKKADKQHKNRIGFFAANFAYGRLTGPGYENFNFASSSDLATVNGLVNPHGGFWRSRELGFRLGLMMTYRIALNLGFEYWLPMNSDVDVDVTSISGTLETEASYESQSTINVYGFNVGVDYYLLNGPNEIGELPGLALRIGLEGGLYVSNWDLWQESGEGFEPMKGTSPGFAIHGGLEYPTQFLGMVLAADAGYFFLNFNDLTSYNDVSGDLELTCQEDGSDLQLDFSGLRGKIELKRYFRW